MSVTEALFPRGYAASRGIPFPARALERPWLKRP